MHGRSFSTNGTKLTDQPLIIAFNCTDLSLINVSMGTKIHSILNHIISSDSYQLKLIPEVDSVSNLCDIRTSVFWYPGFARIYAIYFSLNGTEIR